MKRKFLTLWALLILCVCNLQAQTWTWTGETPAAGSWYLYHPDWGFIHADANSSYPTTNVAAATLFTITGTGTTATKLAYQVGTTTYYLNNSSGTMSINTTGSNLYVRIGNAADGYYITTYNNANFNTSGTGNNRYLNVWDGGAGWSRGDSGSKTQWRFISPRQMREQLSNNSSLTNPFDFTAAIINPGYEDATWNNGWTVDGFVEHGNDGKFVGSHIAEMWSADLVSGSVKQTVNLPQGVYVLKAKISAGFDGIEQYMYAKTTTETRKTYVAGKDGDPAEYYEVMFRVTPSDNNQAEIGFTRENIRWWTAVDDWSLEYLGETPAFTYEMGTRLDGTHLSRPAYTSTPADGVDPDHANDALLVVTWPNENTNDPWSASILEEGAKAHVTAEGVDIQVDLLSHFRTSTYHNGFGLYIPNFDEKKTYTVTVPANVLGYATGNAEAFGKTFTKVMNEEFTINAKQSPIKDGKYFIRVAGTTKHVSRGGHYGTQAILDNYGVPVLVQTAGLTVFKFLDNNAFFGNDPGADDMYTDCFDERTRRYNLIPDDEENPTKVQFFTPARDKYLYHANDAINGVAYEKMAEGDQGDWYDFEPFTVKGYAEHLKGISDSESQRVTERAGLAVTTHFEYETLIDNLSKKGCETVWPKTDDDKQKSEAYHEARNNDLPMEAAWEATPKDLIGAGERQTLTLDEGLYYVGLNAFQQASALEGLQQNLGFRGLVYYYAKVGADDNAVISKAQLMSITETEGDIPTTYEEAKAALTGTNYYSRIVFYVPEDGTEVEFGVQNPQRLGNGIDGEAGSWVAFQNLEIKKFTALEEANMTVKAGKYGTFVAPFQVTLPEGVVAYRAQVNKDKTRVNLVSAETRMTTRILPAATPVILENTTDQLITKVFRGEGDSENRFVTDGVLTGFYVSDATIPTGFYVLQDQGQGQNFYKVIGTFVGAKNRCYLNGDIASNASLRLVFGEDEDEITAIDSVADDSSIMEIYSVNGTRLTEMQRGMNIIKMSNGQVKKVLVK